MLSMYEHMDNWGLFWDLTIAMKEIEDDLKDIITFSRFLSFSFHSPSRIEIQMRKMHFKSTHIS